jgi:cytochrome oxidase assembly protein ShyY1
MKLRHVLAALFVIGMSAVCVRLGFWQISRLHEKQQLNATLRAALAASPRTVDRATPADSATGRRVAVTGTFD